MARLHTLWLAPLGPHTQTWRQLPSPSKAYGPFGRQRSLGTRLLQEMGTVRWWGGAWVDRVEGKWNDQCTERQVSLKKDSTDHNSVTVLI
jgi:hypothetical protein